MTNFLTQTGTVDFSTLSIHQSSQINFTCLIWLTFIYIQTPGSYSFQELFDSMFTIISQFIFNYKKNKTWGAYFMHSCMKYCQYRCWFKLWWTERFVLPFLMEEQKKLLMWHKAQTLELQHIFISMYFHELDISPPITLKTGQSLSLVHSL